MELTGKLYGVTQYKYMLIKSCIVGEHFNSGNLTFTPFHIDSVDSVEFHKHEAGHNVICFNGEFTVMTKDPTCGCERKQNLTVGQHVWIPAGIEHSSVAVSEDAQGVCVFVNGTFDFGVEKSNNGWEGNEPFNIELPENERYVPN